ncbi:hypothetical protein [Inhella proteolytica]|uniref:Uncharacterized protein n=1 Tax=Inhella proteolytica TaxID=2795029 RepID=A0A931J470_9BURK|nr:hypothetical protein [Inhella proteolytica]MBH9579294.1 hypothetical protein [Inhella proteolytica]
MQIEFGPYSEMGKAWMQPSTDGSPYAMRVIQQALVTDAQGQQTLFFAASGQTSDSFPHHKSAVFVVPVSRVAQSGVLQYRKMPLEDELERGMGLDAHDLELVSLGAGVQAWLVNVQQAFHGEELTEQRTDVWVLAFFGGEIHRLASIPTLVEGDGNCQDLDAEFAHWQARRTDPANRPDPAHPATTAPAADPSSQSPEAPAREDGPPPRCYRVQVDYRFAPGAAGSLASLELVQRGWRGQELLPAQQWTVRFNPRSLTYPLPAGVGNPVDD